MAQDRAQKTEKPTGKRLDKARKEGNVARSKELPGALSLAAFLVFAHLFGGDWLGRLKQTMVTYIGAAAQPQFELADLGVIVGNVLLSTASLLVIPLGLMVTAGVGGNLLQGPPTFTLQPLQPDLKKINPISGMKKLIKLKGWIEALKTVAKMVLFSTIALIAVRDAMQQGVPGAPGAEGTLLAIAVLAAKVIFRVCAVALGLAVLDMLFTRFDYMRNLKMTKQEIKDERKESEGDPMIKARLRSKQLQLSRSRMMVDVPNASVVITNPTHFAVALRYVPGDEDIPQVLAKGQGKIAEKIREIALEHRIPIVSDPPLARALYRSVGVGAYIPHALFRAVAEVLALVLRGPGRQASPVEGAR